ncbi:hypothetical protein Nepgr_015992 [Nepenthes gracilis]|uniref:Disease resistance N-terminal domain-containing protein n=1 Tax=Nepenthes gracilis TaxID=150966 RepID=A0AAD3SPM8_NEPGR|nr:hypothetical protein Nepgr_015992 [Nepenthes gracilis]
MVDAIIASAIKWISSQLVDEAKFLCGVKDQMLKLQNDLKCMQQYLKDVEKTQLDEEENGQVTIFTETIQEITFRAEDVIDSYVLKAKEQHLFEILSPSNSAAPSTSKNSRRVIIDSSIKYSRPHAHTRSLIRLKPRDDLWNSGA